MKKRITKFAVLALALMMVFGMVSAVAAYSEKAVSYGASGSTDWISGGTVTHQGQFQASSGTIAVQAHCYTGQFGAVALNASNRVKFWGNPYSQYGGNTTGQASDMYGYGFVATYN